MLIRFIFILLAICTCCYAGVIPRQESCSEPVTRKEWRSLSDTEKSEYIEAVQCLKDTPSRLDTSSASLYDDFAYVHRELDTSIHFVAVFLPWHRWFVHLFEEALQECGYSGNAVYWDWEQDADDPASSPVFDTSLGFGGDGDSSSGCVVDGPFANWSVSTPEDHCLQRNFSLDVLSEYGSESAVDEVLILSSYSLFRPALESGPHRSAHAGIAGDMANNYSPNDPIFFLHHGNIDRIWWEWQSANSSRTYDYGGNRYQSNASTEATLNDEVPSFTGFSNSSYIVNDLMSVEAGPFCYTY